jgi:cell wall-associated NlpC family hydrolase
MTELIEYAKKFIGVSYIWGGSHPSLGFDCSGLIQHILASVGMDPKGDQTAQALFNHFIKEGDEIWEPKIGALMFYGKDKDSITHIAMCVSEHQIIEAGGGGSNTTDLSKAIASEAYVRLRPVDHRKDVLGILMPSYPGWVRQMELKLG